ncbi:hypothetical protein [Specibacter sp. NPDC078709]
MINSSKSPMLNGTHEQDSRERDFVNTQVPETTVSANDRDALGRT